MIPQQLKLNCQGQDPKTQYKDQKGHRELIPDRWGLSERSPVSFSVWSPPSPLNPSGPFPLRLCCTLCLFRSQGIKVLMLLVVIIFKCSIFSHSLCYLSAWLKAWFLQDISSLKTVLLCISATTSFPPTTWTVTSSFYQLSLYILILKLNSQWHSCKFSCLAFR